MLRKFLLANCASCLVFGLLFAIVPVGAAVFIGTPPVWFIQFIGVVLVINAALLVVAVRGYQNQPIVVWFFVVGDLAWVALTVGLSLLTSGLTPSRSRWLSPQWSDFSDLGSGFTGLDHIPLHRSSTTNAPPISRRGASLLS